MRGATALPRDPHRRRLPVWPPHPAGAIPGCGSRAGCCSLVGEPRAGRRDHRRSRGLDRLIETKRLTVRLPQAADVGEIVNYYGANRDHLEPFSPTFAPDFVDRAMWLEQVRIREREHAAGESFRAFLFDRTAPARIVGNLNLTQVHRGALQSCVLGYNLAGAE